MQWREIPFGIEFEAGASADVYNKVVDKGRALGLLHGLNTSRRQGAPIPTVIRERVHDARTWWFGYDGGGIEVKSPVCLDKDWPEVFKMIRHMLNQGCQHNNDQSGMHVHFGTAGLSLEEKYKILLGWSCFEDLFFRLVRPYRRSSGWCHPIRQNATRETWLAPFTATGMTRRDRDDHMARVIEGCTRRAFGPNGGWPTFENRVHHGSLNLEDTYGWVQTIRAMMDHWANDMDNPVEYHAQARTRRSREDQLAVVQGIVLSKLPTYASEPVVANLTDRLARYANESPNLDRR